MCRSVCCDYLLDDGSDGIQGCSAHRRSSTRGQLSVQAAWCFIHVPCGYQHHIHADIVVGLSQMCIMDMSSDQVCAWLKVEVDDRISLCELMGSPSGRQLARRNIDQIKNDIRDDRMAGDVFAAVTANLAEHAHTIKEKKFNAVMMTRGEYPRTPTLLHDARMHSQLHSHPCPTSFVHCLTSPLHPCYCGRTRC